MSLSDSVFNNLRQKLDVMGYKEPLPLAAIPLVGSLFADFVKTTESLRDSKKKIMELLEEKSCWELGVEPYKCDNSRLLHECSRLHLDKIKQQEEYEEKILEINIKIRDLQTDKLHLQQQCEQLQEHLKLMQTKTNTNMKQGKDKDINIKPKKPFITTVRSGNELPALQPLHENNSNLKCTKCNVGYYQRLDAGGLTEKTNEKYFDQLENTNKNLMDQISLYESKIEARDREILRLNELLAGGRPPAVLARECCYKNFKNLKEDIDLLQREKMDSLTHMRDYQAQMHEAMQRALDLEKTNRSLEKQLDELKNAALLVESQANEEIARREAEVEMLKQNLKEAIRREESVRNITKRGLNKCGQENTLPNMDKQHIKEKINALTQKESEMKLENKNLQQKISKLKIKLHSVRKAFKDFETQHAENRDEEKIRLKSERDFFQKEYLRLISKVGSDKEIEFLQNQIKSKDEELGILRTELCSKQSHALVPCLKDNQSLGNSLPSTARSNASSSNSDCVQAVVLRAERERDCARAELERVRCERDTLKEKLACVSKMHGEQMQSAQQHYEALSERLRQLERENRDLFSTRMPTETQIMMLKDELECYRQQQFRFKDEYSKLQTTYNQLKMLHAQTERSLCDYQKKLLVAERQIESSNIRLNTLDTNREASVQEAAKLRGEVAALKETYIILENEKDKILIQLDNKTEKVYQLEHELKASKEKRNCLEQQVTELETQLSKLQNKTRERDTELHETSAESKSLKQQLAALKTSRDQAIQENLRLTNDLADSQAEILILKRQLKDSEKEIEELKQQLKKYVEEVKKAEDLLLQKEKEREEMLNHYRSLSHDAAMLEGNNQSLESETAEYKRQVAELEAEIVNLKKELSSRNTLILELEDKIATLTAKVTCLEHKLAESLDEQQILKIDLTARKELCDKLDIEKDKLNAELYELNDIKRKLELENEKLRLDIEKMEKGKQLSSETLEELLAKTRRDLEEQIKVDSKLNQELLRLKNKNEELLDVAQEKQKREQQQNLVHEYQVQNQELRHNLTDDRFRQARSREQSPRFPTRTL